jgi:hypothetical protein
MAELQRDQWGVVMRCFGGDVEPATKARMPKAIRRLFAATILWIECVDLPGDHLCQWMP